MNFFTRIETPSVQVIELSDLDRLRKYKKELVDSLVYEPPQDLTERKKISQEAANVDRWLADKFKEFMNDNNRKLAS